MLSINSRLLLASGIILIAFFGLTGYTLYNVFRDNLQDAYFEKLHSQVYALIAASEIRDDGTLALAESLPEMQLSIANSGFYGQITRNDGQVVWRSASMVKREIPFRTNLGFGQQVQQILTDSTGQLLYSASFGILWDESRPLTHGFTYSVAELPEGYNAQLKLFGEKLLGSLSAVAVILLLAQTALLRWSLTPLRQVTRELKAIEDGVQHNLRGEYPKELLGLTDNINGLLRTQHEHLERYRHSLADLAHSLKTPLALLRGAVETGGTMKYINQTIEDQIDRMSQIIEYQLQRAATSGRTALSTPLNISSIVTKITHSLDKVYADKAVRLFLDIAAELSLRADEGDLMELFGNVLDNAYKWCKGQVRVSGARMESGLRIIIEDDGPGIPAQKIDQVLMRGMRADENISGHGIGLAIVQDILQAYGARICIQSSGLGGACVILTFPDS